MTNLPAIAVLDIPPKFILEVAYGIRNPAELAEEYGYTPGEWERLKVYPAFVKVVETRKSELVATGVTFRIKSAMMAEDLLPSIYSDAKKDDASFHTRLAAVTFMARAAGLDSPKKDDDLGGNSFSISINLGGGNVVTIGGKPANKVVKEAEYAEGEDEYTDIEDELSYDSTHCFTEFLPHPLPE